MYKNAANFVVVDTSTKLEFENWSFNIIVHGCKGKGGGKETVKHFLSKLDFGDHSSLIKI